MKRGAVFLKQLGIEVVVYVYHIINAVVFIAYFVSLTHRIYFPHLNYL